MVSLFLLLGCNLSYIVDLFAALHELASASARTLLKLASSVRALLKPYGDTLHLKENVKKTIWTERSCVYFDETAIVESLIDKTAWFENSRMPT